MRSYPPQYPCSSTPQIHPPSPFLFFSLLFPPFPFLFPLFFLPSFSLSFYPPPAPLFSSFFLMLFFVLVLCVCVFVCLCALYLYGDKNEIQVCRPLPPRRWATTCIESSLTPPLPCASMLQPATPPQVVAFESCTISAPICLNCFTLADCWQILDKCKDLGLTLLHILILGAYCKFVRKNKMLALRDLFPQPCSSAGRMFAAGRSHLDYSRPVGSFSEKGIWWNVL